MAKIGESSGVPLTPEDEKLLEKALGEIGRKSDPLDPAMLRDYEILCSCDSVRQRVAADASRDQLAAAAADELQRIIASLVTPNDVLIAEAMFGVGDYRGLPIGQRQTVLAEEHYVSVNTYADRRPHIIKKVAYELRNPPPVAPQPATDVSFSYSLPERDAAISPFRTVRDQATRLLAATAAWLATRELEDDAALASTRGADYLANCFLDLAVTVQASYASPDVHLAKSVQSILPSAVRASVVDSTHAVLTAVPLPSAQADDVLGQTALRDRDYLAQQFIVPWCFETPRSELERLVHSCWTLATCLRGQLGVDQAEEDAAWRAAVRSLRSGLGQSASEGAEQRLSHIIDKLQ